MSRIYSGFSAHPYLSKRDTFSINKQSPLGGCLLFAVNMSVVFAVLPI